MPFLLQRGVVGNISTSYAEDPGSILAVRIFYVIMIEHKRSTELVIMCNFFLRNSAWSTSTKLEDGIMNHSDLWCRLVGPLLDALNNHAYYRPYMLYQ